MMRTVEDALKVMKEHRRIDLQRKIKERILRYNENEIQMYETEDEYYKQLGEEIERHPIYNPARTRVGR